MQYTDNTKLNKPEENDFYNVQDLNANMDILDNASIIHYYDGIRQSPSENPADYDIPVKRGDIAVEKTSGASYICGFVNSEHLGWSSLRLFDSGWYNVSPMKFKTNTAITAQVPAMVEYDGNSNNALKVRRIGDVVYLKGCVTPMFTVSEINGSDNAYKHVFEIPASFRPDRDWCFVMQGSGTNKFMLTVHSDGAVDISRYSNSSANAQPPVGAYTQNGSTLKWKTNGAWLNCYASWIVN